MPAPREAGDILLFGDQQSYRNHFLLLKITQAIECAQVSKYPGSSVQQSDQERTQGARVHCLRAGGD